MPSIFVRQTYWNIPCNTSQLPQGIKRLKKVLKAPGQGTPTAERPSLFLADWSEFKVATYGGKQVLLLLEADIDKRQFFDLDVPLAQNLILHQWERRFRPQTGTQTNHYRIYDFVPFRSKEYKMYHQLPTCRQQHAYLQQQLYRHLEVLANRLAWPAAQALQCKDLKVVRTKRRRLAGINHLAFDVRFSTNLLIPEFIGLGRDVTNGCGVVRPVRAARAGRS